MKTLIFSLVLVASLSAGQSKQTFTGSITDEICAGSHAPMRMGPTDAECTNACILAHSARYALYDGKNTYILSDQMLPIKLAGQKVRVTGTLDVKTKTIKVDSITAAK